MNQDANPLDYLIRCCEHAIETGQWKLTKFTILNAKDELDKTRKTKHELAIESAKSNQLAIDEINANMEYRVVAWAKVNDRGDLYDPRLCYNPYEEQIPLYSNDKRIKNETQGRK